MDYFNTIKVTSTTENAICKKVTDHKLFVSDNVSMLAFVSQTDSLTQEAPSATLSTIQLSFPSLIPEDRHIDIYMSQKVLWKQMAANCTVYPFSPLVAFSIIRTRKNHESENSEIFLDYHMFCPPSHN